MAITVSVSVLVIAMELAKEIVAVNVSGRVIVMAIMVLLHAGVLAASRTAMAVAENRILLS